MKAVAFLRACIFIFAVMLPGVLHAEPRMKLGAIISLTGDTANAGFACKNGIEMALDDLSEAQHNQLAVVVEDDSNIPRNTVSAFNKLLARDRIDAVITYFSNPAKALAPIAEAKQVTMIAIASDPEVVQGRKRAFNLWVTPEEEVRTLLAEARCRGYKKIARVVSTQAGVLAYKRVFDKVNRGLLEVVVDEEFSLEVKDFRSFISRLKSYPGLDAVFANVYFGQIGLFARQARELGLHLPLFAIEVFEEPEEVKSSGGALVGQWYVQADDPDGAFLERYRARFPQASLFTAANCYDAVMLAAESLKNGYSPQDWHKYLTSLQGFRGSMGVYSATGDNRFSLPAAVKVVTASGFRRLNSNERNCVDNGTDNP